MTLTRFLARVALLASFAMSAGAQDFPSKPITIVVGYGAGGGVDTVSRVVANRMSEVLASSVVVENKPGASGNIGARAVANAKPDGYTLLAAPWTTYALNQNLSPATVGFDLAKDFAAVSAIAQQPLVLVSPASFPANSVAELIAMAKSKPGNLTFASAGVGTLDHIAGEFLQRQAGIEMVHVPYKTTAMALQDMLGGLVQMLFASPPFAMPALKAGQTKALMVTMPARIPALPDVPTPAEVGLPGFEVLSTYGLLAPAGTPPAILKRLQDALHETLKTPAVATKLRDLGVTPTPNSSADAEKQIRNDLAKWGKIIKDANIKVDDTKK